MEHLVRLERQATALATGVSLWFLLRLWRKGEQFGAQQIVFSAWFIVALITQLVAQSPGVWIAGLVAQVFLAIVLVLKDQLANVS